VTDSAETAGTEASGAPTTEPMTASSQPSWPAEPSAQESAVGVAAEHPELTVGAAFAGGLLLAMILKRLAR
jgi:hypothetical protein